MAPPPASDVDAALLEQLTAIRGGVDECRRYLGGIFGILQQQEGLSSALGELGPMVLQMLGGSAAGGPNGAGPHTHTVIEADRGN